MIMSRGFLVLFFIRKHTNMLPLSNTTNQTIFTKLYINIPLYYENGTRIFNGI
jgi:hypothetical protein